MKPDKSLFLSQFQSNKISQKQNTGKLAQEPVRKRKIEFVSVRVVFRGLFNICRFLILCIITI